MTTQITVALILCSQDVIEMVATGLGLERVRATGVGPFDGPTVIGGVADDPNPTVVVFDLAPP